jgi:D-alanine-D-alanine ligase
MKIKIYVIYGGPGAEHEVSIASAENVFFALDRDLYDAHKIYVQKNKLSIFNGEEYNLDVLIEKLPKDSVVIPVFHGSFGEGGELQKLLESHNILYIGSKYTAASLAISKKRTQDVLLQHCISVPKTDLVVSETQKINIPFPVIVKPNNEGSSIDLYKVHDEQSLQKILIKTLPYHHEMLVQEFVTGKEFTCGVIERKGELLPLLPTEVILTQGELFDYEAKYTKGGCQEITPAQVSSELTEKIQKLAIATHTIIGCRDISRTDMILKNDGTIVVLEINTMPGMTETSFIPAQAKASGYTLSQILDIVIHNYI